MAHSLDNRLTCVRCGMHVNMQHSIPYLEAQLHMRCIASVTRSKAIVLHARVEQYLDDSIYLFHGIATHSTHSMATHTMLHLHFCVACGAYGARRSVLLRRPCRYHPTSAGRIVLADIERGRMPDYRLKAGRERANLGIPCMRHRFKKGRCARTVLTHNKGQRRTLTAAKPTNEVGHKKPHLEDPSFECKGPRGVVSLDLTPQDLTLVQELNEVSGAKVRDHRQENAPASSEPGLFLQPGTVSASTSSSSTRIHPIPEKVQTHNHGCSRHGYGCDWRFEITCDECVSASFELEL